MTAGNGRDGQAPEEVGQVDIAVAVADLRRAVGELRDVARDARERVGRLEQELDRLRTAGGDRADSHGNGSRFEAVYDHFTDRFRGSTAEVTAKLEGYLPDVRALVRDRGVVDLGCGRGEWLTLLRDAGVPARGVDANPAFVAAGRAQGLDMELGDVLGHLRGLQRDSVDMVTAFHVIEHLDIEQLLELLDEAWQVLAPGGCLLLETPNPTNLVMAACDFYNDPTHRAPLPPALTSYLVSSQGFADLEVRPLHPARPPLTDAGGHDGCAQLRQLVVEVLYGPQDYAVLGYKPASGHR